MAAIDKLASYFEPERLMEEALKKCPPDLMIVGLILDAKAETLKAVQNCADSPKELADVLRDLADQLEHQQPADQAKVN